MNLEKDAFAGLVTSIAFLTDSILLVGHGPWLKAFDVHTGTLLEKSLVLPANRIHRLVIGKVLQRSIMRPWKPIILNFVNHRTNRKAVCWQWSASKQGVGLWSQKSGRLGNRLQCMSSNCRSEYTQRQRNATSWANRYYESYKTIWTIPGLDSGCSMAVWGLCCVLSDTLSGDSKPSHPLAGRHNGNRSKADRYCLCT